MTADNRERGAVDWGAIAEAVEGTATSLAAIADDYDVPEDTIDAALAGVNVETCPGCGWWWDSGELDDEGYCPDCQGDDE